MPGVGLCGKLKSMQVETIIKRDQWNNTLRNLPYAHVLQSWEWGEFKQQTTGWQPTRLFFKQDDEVVGAASVLTRSIGPLVVMYVTKGPAISYENATLVREVLDYLQQLARKRFAVWLKIDPDVIVNTGVPGELDDTPYLPGQAVMQMLRERGWCFSDDQVQFRNTINIDLTLDADDLLMQMSQNTRRKVRMAAKKGVAIRDAILDDLGMLYNLYAVTGERDDFLIRPQAYYLHEWRYMLENDRAHALIAELDGEAIAHVILFHFGEKVWYFYGASSNDHRNTMPNYALQWEAMKWAKTNGYHTYDMWGAPDHFDMSDRMWGVYQFKRGFRGQVTRHIGAWDYAPYPWLYRAYVQIWPRILAWIRK